MGTRLSKDSDLGIFGTYRQVRLTLDDDLNRRDRLPIIDARPYTYGRVLTYGFEIYYSASDWMITDGLCISNIM